MLVVLGGLVTLVSGVLVALSPFQSRRGLPGLDVLVDVITYGFLVLALGLVAVFGSRYVTSLGWSIAIIGIGILAFRFDTGFLYTIGPLMIVIGGIVGLLTRLV